MKPTYEELEAQVAQLHQEIADRANAEASMTKLSIEDGEMIVKLEAERDQLRIDHDEAYKLLSDMCAVVNGEGCGPKRGVVEDIADLKAERDQLVRIVESAGTDNPEAVNVMIAAMIEQKDCMATLKADLQLARELIMGLVAGGAPSDNDFERYFSMLLKRLEKS